MSADCGACKFVVPQTKNHKMSKCAYRAHVLRMCTSFMKTFMFNILVFFIGATLGMSFTILNVQRVWKEKYQYDTVVRLQHTLKKNNIDIKDVNDLLMQLKDEQAKMIGQQTKPVEEIK